jgi:hypothetical protein
VIDSLLIYLDQGPVDLEKSDELIFSSYLLDKTLSTKTLKTDNVIVSHRDVTGTKTRREKHEK